MNNELNEKVDAAVTAIVDTICKKIPEDKNLRHLVYITVGRAYLKGFLDGVEQAENLLKDSL